MVIILFPYRIVASIKYNGDSERALKSAVLHEGKVALFVAKTSYKNYQLLGNKVGKE